MKTDIVIVGAGVIGLSLAVFLQRQGISTICVEMEYPGYGCSAHSLGLVYPLNPLYYPNHMVNLGLQSYYQYTDYISYIGEFLEDPIVCNDKGLLQIAFSQQEFQDILATAHAYESVGVDVTTIGASEVLALEPYLASTVVGGIFFPNAFHINVEKLISALTTALRSMNGVVLENETVFKLIIEKDVCQGVLTTKQMISAGLVVLCTGAWNNLIDDLIGEPLNMIEPIRGQSIVLLSPEATINTLIYTANLDVIPRQNGEVLVGSTTESVGFSMINTVGGIEFLTSAFMKTFPQLDHLELKSTWVGLRPKTIDAMPVLGDIPHIKRLQISSGYYRNGIFFAPAISSIHSDFIINGIRSQYLDIFSPTRFLRK